MCSPVQVPTETCCGTACVSVLVRVCVPAGRLSRWAWWYVPGLLDAVHHMYLERVHVRGLVLALWTAQIWQLLGSAYPRITDRHHTWITKGGGGGHRVEGWSTGEHAWRADRESTKQALLTFDPMAEDKCGMRTCWRGDVWRSWCELLQVSQLHFLHASSEREASSCVVGLCVSKGRRAAYRELASCFSRSTSARAWVSRSCSSSFFWFNFSLASLSARKSAL